MTQQQPGADEVREFWLQRRQALLLEVQAIERLYPSSSVTVTLKREHARRLQLLN